jgi:hypothetical protein
MAPLRPRLTLLRRAVGVAVVSFLLSCAVALCLAAPGLATFGSRASTTANSPTGSFPDPTPSRIGSQSPSPGGSSSTADPPRASDPTPPTLTTTPAAGDNTASGSAGQETIQLKDPPVSAKPFETVRIRGTYRGGADTLLRMQRWEGGMWLDFPIPTKTDQSGEFTAHIELERSGRFLVRVQDPKAGVESEPFELVIRS